MKHRGGTEGAAGRDGERPREHQDAPVEIHFREAGCVRRKHVLQQLQGDAPDHEAGGRAEERQHHAFGEQLPRDPPRRRADGRANRDLPFPGDRARQTEIGDVGAGDHQHRDHRADEHQQPRTDAADNGLLQRHGSDLAIPVVRHGPWEEAAHACLERANLALDLLPANAFMDPSDDRHEVPRPIPRRVARVDRGIHLRRDGA